MGVSEGSEGGGIGAECGVGTIVWVRRRNGSWWPGRILGPEELSASHLMSPRSGTPVKLLGREDASVDWYNLEKSKRVKAFRCGEFDACIERAEAAQGAPIKKREKYARREDAILHALELEKQILQRKQQKLTGNSSNKHSGASRKEQNIVISGHQLRIDESADHSRFISNPQFLSGRVLSPPATSMDNSLRSHKRKGVKNYSWENDNTEATPRMRGLQDFGLRSAQSKMKDVEGVPSILSNKGCAPLKKRRSNGGINDDLLTKRRDRRRPLVQVLQSSVKLPPPHCLPSTSGSIPISMHKGHDQVLYERKDEDCGLHDSSELLDYTGYSDHMDVNPSLFGRSGALIVQNTSTAVNESGLLEGAFSDPDPDTEDDETIYPGNAQSLGPASRSTEQYAEDDSLTFTDEENYENLNEDDESSYIFPHSPHEQNTDNTADMGVSKWNMKGKRNIRTLTKRSAGGRGDNIHRSAKHGRSSESNRHVLKIREERQTPQALYGKNDFIYESDFIKKELHPRFARYDKRNSSLSNGTSRDNRDGLDASDKLFSGISSTGWVSDLPSHTDQVACLAPKGDSSSPFCAGHLVDIESRCVDVDLKVQATLTYQGEHVPLVSLMSRWNGKAIVGHPVQIETVGDGSTLALLPKNFPREDSDGADGNVTSPSVRKTGRRTAMQRVPRPHPRPSESEDKEHDSLLYTDPEMKTTFKKPYPVNFDNGTRLTKKGSHNHNRQGMLTKVRKKSSKKVSLSNQKTRKLSSLATQQKHSKSRPVDGKLTTKGCAIDGFIKPGGVVPIVTCVPVKVVFSRILEAVGRSPSTATAHRGLLSGSSQEKPS